MIILYVGDLWNGSTALQRLMALKEWNDCDTVDSTYKVKKLFERAWYKLVRETGLRVDLHRVNKETLAAVSRKAYDVVWIDKGINVFPETLRRIKSQYPDTQIVSYSPDDMFNPDNQTVWYLKSMKLYDLHVTTKSYNVNELKTIGAKDVFFVDKSYDPAVHRKMELTKKENEQLGCDIGFVGRWEEDRYSYILHLAASGHKVTVTGAPWRKYMDVHPNLIINPQNKWADDYARILNATRINLCFLSKANRDLQTARSIEIPACGGFMLAERTAEHSRLFQEDKEAVFFSSPEELVEKVNYYLDHEEERLLIAEAGYLKCIHAGYSHANRLRQVMDYIVTRNS